MGRGPDKVKKVRRGAPLSERFWSKVEKQPGDACWLWLGHRRKKGYGMFGISSGRMDAAHRVAWRITFGDPGELHVLHRCDNPPCVRPDHLFLGTNAENTADKMSKGRHRVLSGEESRTRKLNAEQVREIRASSETCAVLGARYGVSLSTVSHIRTGRLWRALA